MTIRIIINGIHGKMGHMAAEYIERESDLTLIRGVTKTDHLATVIRETRPDVVLDLTRADVVFQNAQTIIEAGVHPVIGTSGLTSEAIKTLESLCAQKSLGGIIAPNFSIGAILMMRYAMQAATYFNAVEIIEAHHTQKFDAPSGTAMKTAEMIHQAQINQTPQTIPSHEIVAGARGGNLQNIPIHSIRLPGIIAKQEVLFGGVGETLSITHNSTDRTCFMPGIILCCREVVKLRKLMIGMEQFL